MELTFLELTFKEQELTLIGTNLKIRSIGPGKIKNMNQHVNKKNPKELTFLPGILELTFKAFKYDQKHEQELTFKVNN